MTQQIKARRDTLANWTTNNPILGAGEIGFALDAPGGLYATLKVGDGTTAWSSLPWSRLVTDGIAAGVSGGGSSVSGAPIIIGTGAPVYAAGQVNGSIYFRMDGGSGNPTIYQLRGTLWSTVI